MFLIVGLWSPVESVLMMISPSDTGEASCGLFPVSLWGVVSFLLWCLLGYTAHYHRIREHWGTALMHQLFFMAGIGGVLLYYTIIFLPFL